MKDLIEDIKKHTFQPVYLLYGEEPYLKQQYKKKLVDAILPGGDTMNLTIYRGKGIEARSVIDQAETMPFFAEKRLILIEDSGFFKSGGQELVDYMKEISPQTCIVFVEEEVDKRGKLYKAVKSAGRVVEFTRQDERSLSRWILGMMKREKKQITEATLHLFMEMAGNDMGNIQMELEKLFCYTMGRDEITPKDVETICVARMENKIFEMVRAIAEKQQKKALELYYDLLALKEPPMRILFLIARQFNQLLQVKELKNQGYDQRGIADRMKLQGFIVRNLTGQAGHFSYEELEAAVRECVEVEEAVKTGLLNDQMSVELLIVKFSTEKEKAAG